MMNRNSKWLSYCAGACIIAGTALAQVGTAPSPNAYSSPTRTDSTVTDTARSHFIASKDLVGTNIKDSQGEKIGDIRELYVNPHNGLTLATVDISGSRDAVVPLQALNISESKAVLGKKLEITLNKTKADLQSGPTIDSKELNKLDDSSFAQQVCAAYNVQMPSGMGAAESSGGTTTGHSPRVR